MTKITVKELRERLAQFNDDDRIEIYANATDDFVENITIWVNDVIIVDDNF